jgi:hypothetical protein
MMGRATLVMACVACTAAIGGAVIISRPTTSEQSVYIKRIAGAMCFAAALILGMFAIGIGVLVP